MALCAENALCHERCCRFLAAAGSLLSDSAHISAEFADTAKIARYVARVAHKEFRHPNKERGKEAIRFLSAVTPNGITVFEQTPQTLCNRIYILEDEYGAVSRLFMNALRACALENGLNIISCYCMTSPFEKLEHILIPELSLAFLSANRYHPFTHTTCTRRIHAKRFLNMEGMKTRKQRLSFNRKAAGGLICEAEELLKEAQQWHNALEKHYISHMDFDKVNQKTEEVVDAFSKLF